MNRLFSRVLAVAVVCGVPGLASAADPDVKGKWTGKTHTIIAGKDGTWPSSTGTYDKPGLFEKDVVIEIVGQEGRRFWGKSTFTGGGETATKPFVGHIHGKDGNKLIYADQDGYLNGEIVGDVLSYCYALAPGAAGTSTLVSCTEVKKAK